MEYKNKTEAHNRPEVLRDSGILFISELAQVILGLGIIGILSHDLSVSRFGFWFSILAVFQLLMITDFGFSTVVARLVPNPDVEISSLIRRVRISQFAICLVIIPICMAILLVVFDSQEVYNPPVFLLGASTLATSLTNINRSFLRTVGLSSDEVRISLVDRGLTFFLLIICRVAYGTSEIGYLLAFISGPIFGLLFSSRLVNLQLSKIGDSGKKIGFSDLHRESMPFAMDSVLAPISESATRIILLMASGTVAVAIFEVAWKVFVGGSSIVRAIRKSMISAYSQNNSDRKKMEGSINDSRRMIKWLTPLGIFCGSLGSFLIPLVFSDNYIQSIPVFLILLSTWAIMLLGSSQIVFVQASQHGNKFLFLTGIGTLVQISFAIHLTEVFGEIGASLSIFIGQLTMTLISIYFTWNTIFFNKSRFEVLFSLPIIIGFVFLIRQFSMLSLSFDFVIVPIFTCVILVVLFNIIKEGSLGLSKQSGSD